MGALCAEGPGGGSCENNLWERALKKRPVWGHLVAVGWRGDQGPSMFVFTEAGVCLEESHFPRGSRLGE